MKTVRAQILVVKKNMDKYATDLRKPISKGLEASAKHIHEETDRTPPMVPVLTGALRNSFYTDPVKSTNSGWSITFGYSIPYAFRTHELMDGKFKRPGSGPKFLESHLFREAEAIVNILADYIRNG